MKDLITKIAKIVAALGSLTGTVLIVMVILVINPWNVPAIFKRNYPDWFEAHPFISNLIKID